MSEKETSMSRNDMIHAKGFDINRSNVIEYSNTPVDYNKIKVGVKNLEDAVLNLGSTAKSLPNYRYVNKAYVLKMIAENNIEELRNISNFYYNINGMYQKICNAFAFLYRYDWYVAPEIIEKNVNKEKVAKDFRRILRFLDGSYIKKFCGDCALEVIRNGAYYGYIVPNKDGLIVQQLPIKYCRSRYNVGNMPAVEFNMKYFDTFTNPAYRLKVLKLFPDEFAKGYIMYKKGQLVDDNGYLTGDGWYLLDVKSTVKFNFNNSDTPLFVSAVPALIDLDAAQDLDRRKQMQQLLKIIIQKLPMDKNGELIFDIDEARDIHNNAVQMLSRAIGVDVLTTFADIESVNLSDKNTTTTSDDLAKVERTVFNNVGMSQNLFNTNGNLSLDKSILNDESSARNIILQFNIFFDRVTKALNVNKSKYTFKFYMLETTQYNYRDLAKIYKEQTQLGYSKMLPQIALGHSQSFILDTAKFENEILDLTSIMIPPMSSNTMNGKDFLGANKKSGTNKTQSNTGGNKQKIGEEKTPGRPEKPDDQKSDKTIANRESMS